MKYKFVDFDPWRLALAIWLHHSAQTHKWIFNRWVGTWMGNNRSRPRARAINIIATTAPHIRTMWSLDKHFAEVQS